ncbi:MAG: branched-chain amino acid ABC transporter permease [Thermoleophilia bacterium]
MNENTGTRKLNPLAAILAGGGPSWVQRAVLGAVVAFALMLPFLLQSNRWLTLFTIVFIYVVLASGLNIVVGFTGLLDLGYVAFYAIGGYFTAIIMVQLVRNRWGIELDSVWWLVWLNLLFGGVVAAVAGAVLGYPTLRLRGDYLAIMTLGFHEIIRIVANNWVGLTRGPSGISGIPKPSIFGFDFNTQFRFYYLALGMAILSLFVISRMVRSRIGRAWTAIREDEVAAEAMGIHTSRYKLLAYAAGGFFAGTMGAFLGHYLNFIHPSNFKLMESITVLSLVVLGGMGNLAGPAVGAVIWMTLLEWLRDFEFVQSHPEVRGILMGLVLVTLMVFRPKGLFGSRRVALEMHPAPPGAVGKALVEGPDDE